MIVKTKKYQLSTGQYMKVGLKNILKEQWWVVLIALAICSGTFFLPSVWWIIGAVIALILYILFWVIQFAGVPHLEQGKMFFERLSYEIDSRQILIKLNPKQGMPVKWDMIKKAYTTKEAIVLVMSKVQFIYLPNKIFKTENEIKFIETILKRKGYIK
ncbi:YcxB family protein [Xanthovirga aplysinae]|uniref:YcxB family protein n=1 Tax=Xanthovirga aplysinae TaxID=2529853 RepID=UPI0012BC8A1B|nr:YcxB family protein [Xanthovirga aplysinae]MTI33054.1 YcxB family protein [Xanthovirga aplysinae]